MSGVLQLKRATDIKWQELNLVLAAGEPGFEKNTNRLKIGDGITPWNELPYLGDENVINAKTHYDFPTIGRENTIYKAESEGTLYQWNAEKLKYELLGQDTSSGALEIEHINGGTAG